MKSVDVERPWLKSYPEGARAEIDVQPKSVNTVFDEVTDKWKRNTALVFYGKKITYGELRDKVDRLATALFDLGVKKGDRVALLLLNSPEYIMAFFAALRVGAAVTPISPVYVSSEIRHQLENSGAEHLICLDILYEGVERAGVPLKNVILTTITDSLPRLRKIMGKSILRGVYEKRAAPAAEILNDEGFHRLHDLIKRSAPNPPDVEIDPLNDLAWLPYTGGTTGLPKAAMVTHYNMVVNVAQLGAFLTGFNHGKETFLGYMPFYHVAGFMVGPVHTLLHGFTIVILTTPEADDILNAIAKYDISMFTGAPAVFEALKDYDKTDLVDWNQVKMIVSAADALHDVTAKDWKSRTGREIHEYYGQTELTCTVMGNPVDKTKLGSIGVPLPGTDAIILQMDRDESVPEGELGELAVRGPQMTSGYWKTPEATKDCEAFIYGCRWWRTGDIARMDEDGYFFIYDRKKDVIKYKGLQVLAREVEEILKTHPNIKEVGVIGIPDIKVGESVKAFVVLESDARGNLSEQEILGYCQDKMAHYKIPRTIEFVGEIPKTDMGKVSRRELREQEE